MAQLVSVFQVTAVAVRDAVSKYDVAHGYDAAPSARYSSYCEGKVTWRDSSTSRSVPARKNSKV